MNTIYTETLGNERITYSAFSEMSKEINVKTYGIYVKDNYTNSEITLRDFTSVKETVIDFIETLIRNTVSPEFVKEIAEDYLIAG